MIHDIIRSAIWDREEIPFWCRQNIVFVAPKDYVFQNNSEPNRITDIVYPELLKDKIDEIIGFHQITDHLGIVSFTYRTYLKCIMANHHVQLDITPNNGHQHRIILDIEKIPFKSQGMIEGGFEVWKQSAKKALEVALEYICPAEKLDIIIQKIEGLILLEIKSASLGIACLFCL